MEEKMKIVGTKIVLKISEPWDASKIVIGIVVQEYLKNEKNYLLIEAISSTDRFMVSNRYKDDDVTEIMQGKTVVVAIDIPNYDFPLGKEQNVFSQLKYYGIGSIELFLQDSL